MIGISVFSFNFFKLYLGYDMSKLLVNNLVRLYARKASSDGKNVLINSVCPGFCDTDMTSGVPCEKVL